MTDIIVPALGESVSEAIIAKWMKKVGDKITQNEPLVELETDKVTLEVNASRSGILQEIKSAIGSNVAVGDVIGVIAHTDNASLEQGHSNASKEESLSLPSDSLAPASSPSPSLPLFNSPSDSRLSPAASKMVNEQNIDPNHIQGTGKDNRITKGDVLNFTTDFASQSSSPAPKALVEIQPPAPSPSFQPTPIQEVKPVPSFAPHHRSEERVRMSRLRSKIATRLMHSQKSTATLTTFNEIDMTNIMAIREHFKDNFEKKHGTRLGFMSFFVKAAIVALKEIPAVNAEIDGEDIVYKNFYDIGVAVGTPQGLVVPVVRDADIKSFAGIELDISTMALKARDGKLSMQDMSGGTFTISNGGVYGSLMSTPILNPPQSGILGMHKIEKRPIVIQDKIEIRPMMYVALSYDHRIIDGTESVTFLKRIKECIENPERILLEI